MRAFKKLFSIAVVTIFICLFVPGAEAQSGQRYFPETGYSVEGDFLEFYQSLDDPALLLGYPISNEIIDPASGLVTQYFQRGRLDRTIVPGGTKILPAPLGEIFYNPGAPLVDINVRSGACRRYPETGHYVCYGFLQFFNDHNGADILGQPISEMEYQDGRYVQYFRNGRLEYLAQNTTGERITVTDLGSIYMRSHIGEISDGMAIVSQLTDIQTHAFVAQALTPTGSTQTIFVIVQDMNLKPIEGASVMVVVRYPNGKFDTYRGPSTNMLGISQIEFRVNSPDIRQIVQVEVHSEYSGISANTNTWFRLWW